MVIHPGENPKEKIVYFECTRLVLEHRILKAVKYYRDQTGVSLAEAKEYIDELCDHIGVKKDNEPLTLWDKMIGCALLLLIIGIAFFLIGIPISLIFF
jgi:hypothetical protein